MFSFTAKITKTKVVALLLFVCAVGLISFCFNISSNNKSPEFSGKTAEKRIEFLARFGWECEAESETAKDVVIPTEFDEVYESYNKIQLAQGYDLTKYKGKSAKLYSIKILNYPKDSEFVYSSIMVYDGKIIGGDIHSTSINGFMHGFSKQ